MSFNELFDSRSRYFHATLYVNDFYMPHLLDITFVAKAVKNFNIEFQP